MVVLVQALVHVVVHRLTLVQDVQYVSSNGHFQHRIVIVFYLAVCVSACQNGGTCSAPNTCTCPATYTGATCTTRMCIHV